MTPPPNWRGIVPALIAASLWCHPVGAQEPAVTREAPAREVRASVTVPLPGQGRNIVIQRVAPPAQPAVQSALAPARVARPRPFPATESAALAETRLLPITVIPHSNGWSHLSWCHASTTGEMQTYEAWSNVDFRSLWILPEFEANGAKYLVLPVILDGSFKSSGQPPLPPAALDNADARSSYRLVKGDPGDVQAINAIEGLHALYRSQGARLGQLSAAKQEQLREEDARRKANPPVSQDTVIKLWPRTSRRHATMETTPQLFPAK